MSATIPGYINYTVPPVAASATANVIALTLPVAWTLPKGSVGFLSLTVTTDGDTAFIRGAGGSVTAAPEDPLISAQLVAADGIRRTARLGPIPRSDIADYEIYTSGATTSVVYQWLPITEWGN